MKYLILFIAFVISNPIFGQYDRVDVFPDLEGPELLQAVINSYKTNSVLSYGDARDVLYGDIDLVNDTLTCVYTGLQVYISPNEDPSTAAFDQNINTEHTFPRSKGAQEFTLGYSDMHHLFPTRVDANTARGVLPFSEINDNVTDRWYTDDITVTNKPSSNIDNYSEYHQNIAFEPREDHKGNVARAYFYFYTMYKPDADIADGNYFNSQRETMCEWHFDDPVDQKEWNRSKDIAAEQGNQNPFILDCSLARIYCSDISNACLTVSTESIIKEQNISFINSSDVLKISGHKDGSDFQLYTSTGRLVASQQLTAEETLINLSTIPTGFYIATVTKAGRLVATSKILK